MKVSDIGDVDGCAFGQHCIGTGLVFELFTNVGPIDVVGRMAFVLCLFAVAGVNELFQGMHTVARHTRQTTFQHIKHLTTQDHNAIIGTVDLFLDNDFAVWVVFAVFVVFVVFAKLLADGLNLLDTSYIQMDTIPLCPIHRFHHHRERDVVFVKQRVQLSGSVRAVDVDEAGARNIVQLQDTAGGGFVIG